MYRATMRTKGWPHASGAPEWAGVTSIDEFVDCVQRAAVEEYIAARLPAVLEPGHEILVDFRAGWRWAPAFKGSAVLFTPAGPLLFVPHRERWYRRRYLRFLAIGGVRLPLPRDVHVDHCVSRHAYRQDFPKLNRADLAHSLADDMHLVLLCRGGINSLWGTRWEKGTPARGRMFDLWRITKAIGLEPPSESGGRTEWLNYARSVSREITPLVRLKPQVALLSAPPSGSSDDVARQLLGGPPTTSEELVAEKLLAQMLHEWDVLAPVHRTLLW